MGTYLRIFVIFLLAFSLINTVNSLNTNHLNHGQGKIKSKLNQHSSNSQYEFNKFTDDEKARFDNEKNHFHKLNPSVNQEVQIIENSEDNNNPQLISSTMKNSFSPIQPSSITIENSGDMVMAEGESGKDVTWEVSGDSKGNTKHVRIIRNGIDELYSCYKASCWGTVSLNGKVGNDELRDRPEGIWTYTLEAFGDNTTLDPPTNSSVIVTVIHDEGSPIFIDTPSNQSFEKGKTGNKIKWKAIDQLPGKYRIYINGNIVVSGDSWVNSSYIEFDGINDLDLGASNITIQVFDELDKSSTHTVFILLLDTIPPIFSEVPRTRTIYENTTGNSIIWRAMDRNPTIFNITINDNFFTENTIWDNSTILEANLDELTEGIYEFTISVYDLGENVNSNSVTVTVIGSPPTINNIADFSFNEGSKGNVITWTANDANPANYVISSNSTLLFDTSGVWTNEKPIEIQLDELKSGVYEFSITFYDIVGNSNFDRVVVRVIDIQNPLLKAQTVENTFVEGGPDKVEWEVSDANPGTYSIYVNGELVVSSVPWGNDGVISYELDNLPPGDYNITIVITDSFDNQNANSVFITITESPTPFYRKTIFILLSAVLIGLLLLSSVYIYYKYQKGKERSLRESLSLVEIKGLLAIQMFMILRPGGIPIYQERFIRSDIDPNLLGGFSSAISTFMQDFVEKAEIQEKDQTSEIEILENFETMEKHGLSIISHQSPNSTILVVCNDRLPEILYRQLYQVHQEINQEFGDYIFKSKNMLPEDVLHSLFQKVGIKLKLINQLEIDLEEIEQIIEHPTLSEESKTGLILLREFSDESPLEIQKFRIKDLLDFYIQKGYKDTKAADFLIFAHDINVIK